MQNLRLWLGRDLPLDFYMMHSKNRCNQIDFTFWKWFFNRTNSKFTITNQVYIREVPQLPIFIMLQHLSIPALFGDTYYIYWSLKSIDDNIIFCNILWYFTNALKKVNIFFPERDEQGLRWILQLRNCGPRQIGKYCALAKSRAGTSSTEWNVEIEPKKLVIPLEPVIEVKWIFNMFSLCHVLKVFLEILILAFWLGIDL